jgi:insertion element IS1 protein InsB
MLDRLERLQVSTYYSDGWDAYTDTLPKGKLVQTKAETHGVERDNFRQRHWCGRFRRQTCMVSRSLLMVDLTVSLFARFHVNGTREDIAKYFDNPF